MSITDQLDTQLHANCALEKVLSEQPPAFMLLLRVEATPLDLRHNPPKLDVLRKLEDYRMMPERRMKKILT